MDLREEVRLREAALFLRNAPELLPFVTWLKTRRETARDRLEAAPTERDSGRSLELKEILELIEDAPQVLEKLRGKPRV